MAKRFPKDCWDKKCPHFHTRDLSIDDLVCTCDLLKIQCDACDEDFSFYLCPLPNEPKERGAGDMGRYDPYTDTFIKERGAE